MQDSGSCPNSQDINFDVCIRFKVKMLCVLNSWYFSTFNDVVSIGIDAIAESV